MDGLELRNALCSPYRKDSHQEIDNAAMVRGHICGVSATEYGRQNFLNQPSVPSFESGSAGSRSSSFILVSVSNFGSVVIVSLLLSGRFSFETDNGMIEEMGIKFSLDIPD